VRGANLSGANLFLAGWTIEQLEQVIDITGCIMPDGRRLARPATPFSEAIKGWTFEERKAR